MEVQRTSGGGRELEEKDEFHPPTGSHNSLASSLKGKHGVKSTMEERRCAEGEAGKV